tara:strand:+ start:6741 stop:7631 length:891 start_codon:yes stop_codon:yes gene_type:complete
MKACINYISSRHLCIKHSLKSLWDNYNKSHDYPVYVYYFDDIYDSPELQESITHQNAQNVTFRSVPYKTPEFLKEEELFYNRLDLWYPRTRFSIQRKGYLHMCNFTSNMYGYENTDFHLYDYIMTHDDEAGYTTEMPYDPFEVMESRPESIGAYAVNQRLKNGHPHQGHRDTRVGLWEFTEKFLRGNNVTPEAPVLQQLLEEPKANELFHYIKWCDTYVIKTEMFKSDLWKKWITAVNEDGGIYKYRWGDNEIITLFSYIYNKQIYNLKTVEAGLHDQGMFRSIQDYAPSVKDTKK